MRNSKKNALTRGAKFVVFLTLTTLIFYTSCKKKNNDNTPTPSGTSLSNKDTAYVDSIALNNSEEIIFGRLAMQKATDSSVKSFATMMVTDHTKTKNSLDSLASKKNYKAKISSDSLDANHRILYNTLSSMAAGWEWDSTYMTNQLFDHYATYNILSDAALKADDADLKSFATKTEAVVASHAQMDTTIMSNNGYGTPWK